MQYLNTTIRHVVDRLAAVALATSVFALVLMATYYIMVVRSPAEFRNITKKELLVIAAILLVFFTATCLLINCLK
jgi:hypothetical protein